MKLYLIRHGQTDWNLVGKIQGSQDIELNSTGIIQAEQLSEKIVKDDYECVRFSRFCFVALKIGYLVG